MKRNVELDGTGAGLGKRGGRRPAGTVASVVAAVMIVALAVGSARGGAGPVGSPSRVDDAIQQRQAGAGSSGPASESHGTIAERYREAADRLIDVAVEDDFAYRRLALLVDTFGHRFTGSDSLEEAIDWILAEMEADGLENVHGEEVEVSTWTRGAESARMVEPRDKALPMLALGGSVGTPPDGLTAEVLVVGSFEELQSRAGEAAGKIVVFNVPFTGYGETVRYRYGGAIAAARAGAVAALLRSVTPHAMAIPHTGMMAYDEEVERIPFAAITVEDAELLQRLQDRGERAVVELRMEAENGPKAISRNVVGEIVGSERPEEVVVVGGHIDSWDLGQGAMDDAGGCVAAWEAVRLMHELGLRPKRTVRVVMWTNEEFGIEGGRAYRDAHVDELDDLVLAIESDSGVFEPLGFGFTGSDEAYGIVQSVGGLLERIGADDIRRGGGGADIGPMMREGVPGMGLRVQGDRYFWYHHTAADTVDKLEPEAVARCVAALAVMAYVIADWPEALPRQEAAPVEAEGP